MVSTWIQQEDELKEQFVWYMFHQNLEVKIIYNITLISIYYVMQHFNYF
jgi:hypothetical protein